MTRVVVDAELRSKLLDLTQRLEICDEAGKVLARLEPVIDMSEWEPVGPEVSDEEIERRLQSNERRYTTAEVLEHLRKL